MDQSVHLAENLTEKIAFRMLMKETIPASILMAWKRSTAQQTRCKQSKTSLRCHCSLYISNIKLLGC